jgi:CcmD family protein
MNYLYAAFCSTWIIHVLYLISLTRGYARVREEIRELNERK